MADKLLRISVKMLTETDLNHLLYQNLIFTHAKSSYSDFKINSYILLNI